MDALQVLILSWFYTLIFGLPVVLAANASNCSCGYLDSNTGNLFTDSIIVYFNETSAFPDHDFVAESYTNKYEQGWNSVFRQAADPANVAFANDSSSSSNSTSTLRLTVSPASTDHVVTGGGIRTHRQDILYGTFRAMLKSPQKNTGGSSLSMMLQYNRTSRIAVGLQNGDVPSHAWMTTLVNGEFPNLDLGVNYTNLSDASYSFGAARPWDFNEVKVDWTPSGINFFYNGHPMRYLNESAKDDTVRPSTPSPFTIKHWSTGDVYSMYGPPTQAPADANVEWMMLFFNTSSMSLEKRQAFDRSCVASQACAVDDDTLRGSTSFPAEAVIEYTPPDVSYQVRWWAVGLGSFSLCITIMVLLNLLLRWSFTRTPKPRHSCGLDEPAQAQHEVTAHPSLPASGYSTPLAFHHTPLISGYVTPVSAPGSPRDQYTFSQGSPALSPPDLHNLTCAFSPARHSAEIARANRHLSELIRASHSPAEKLSRNESMTSISKALANHESMASSQSGSRHPSLTQGTSVNRQYSMTRAQSLGRHQSSNPTPAMSRNQSMTDMIHPHMQIPPSMCLHCHHCSEQLPLPPYGRVDPRSTSLLGQASHRSGDLRGLSMGRAGGNSDPRTLTLLNQLPGSRDPRTTSLTSHSANGGSRANSFLGRAVEGITYGPAMAIEDLGRGEVAGGGVSVPPSRTATMGGSRASTMVGSDTNRGPGGPPPVPPVPPLPQQGNPSAPAASRTRVDYLAGLVGVCSMLVSLTHFMLTFVPATIEPGAFAHYNSEIWTEKTIGPFFFNEVWVVIFFTTSTRFLTTKYLRSGDLASIAEKVVGRVFRLMIPIMGVILLEYFLMDVGAINWLQYLPSVTWSTWVYTTVFPNFGSFVNETIQLIYLIPNAMPSITLNYCTGVLWTIPVQIQGSWQAMLGVIVIREIKTPWKRFGYYAFCISMHWYARSWGSFFMAGLLLADLDITFKYRKYLYAHPWIYYPLLNLAILLTLIALGNDLTASWTGFDLATTEAGWHPSRVTGRFLVQNGPVAFPEYYYPKLNGLIFAIGSQLVVEWSRWVQKAVSTKAFLWLFPHIFTIYLFHGFIFWSAGAWICVGLASHGIPYWANMIVTAAGSYACLFASLPLITPVVEALGKTATASIWQAASEQPPPKLPTLHPFPKNLFTCRGSSDASEDGSSITAASRSSQERAAQEQREKKAAALTTEDIRPRDSTDDITPVEEATTEGEIERKTPHTSKQDGLQSRNVAPSSKSEAKSSRFMEEGTG